jgi:hypothetical protein
MSMEVPLEDLSDVAHLYGPTAFAAVSAPDGPPRLTHVAPHIDGTMITIGLGQSSIALLGQNATLGLLWPANEREAMSLIVDTAVDEILPDGLVRVRALSGVRHRPAPSV